jgi:NADH-quinone oxidoreductase subunit G
MPTITINGRRCEFKPGQMILQVANDHGVSIPQYCYHDGLSIVASCRICLVEIHAPDPKSGKVGPFMGGKLLPSCQTPAADGMIVYADSPKAVQNQKAVMEYLLINHPLDCPVCDQAGECFLQDYSYQYGRSVSRFEDDKVKQPKKDLGPHIYLYSDRCIMCSRCVRFTREVTGTGELMIQGRGNKNEIDVFPGQALDNPLSGNVADLCPVGALLDKDFLFVQRVWFLKETPSIDPLTASGDNITIHHNEGKIYRVKPRTNLAVNKWWITDEVRYGWKFVHSEQRLKSPMRRHFGTIAPTSWTKATEAAVGGLRAAVLKGQRLGLIVSPMLSCEDAFELVRLARLIDPRPIVGLGPIPCSGEDRVFPPDAKRDDPKAFVQYAEKAPNARGVRRVLEATSGGSQVHNYESMLKALGVGSGRSDIGAVLLTGNYPSDWATNELIQGLSGKFVTLIDTLSGPLVEHADVVLPSCTWAEKSGTFENARNMLQGFEQAIAPIEGSKSEAQIALELIAALAEPTDGTPAERAGSYSANETRHAMAEASTSLSMFASGVSAPAVLRETLSEMPMVEL